VPSSRRVKRPVREAYLFSPASAEIRNEESYTSTLTPTYAFMACTNKTLLLYRSVRQIYEYVSVHILHLNFDARVIQTPVRKCGLRSLNYVLEMGGAYI
jgi:hypothetical protein